MSPHLIRAITLIMCILTGQPEEPDRHTHTCMIDRQRGEGASEEERDGRQRGTKRNVYCRGGAVILISG